MKNRAELELEILEKTGDYTFVLEFKEDILRICKTFSESGQSGGSAPYVANAVCKVIKSLMLYEPLSPLTGEDYEWAECGSPDYYQNIRDGRVFKNKNNGEVTFIEGIVFREPDGSKFTGSAELKKGKNIGSSTKIKSFPFTPKTFYIDVNSLRFKDKEGKIPDENGDWWTHRVKKLKQLEEVYEYYDVIFK